MEIVKTVVDKIVITEVPKVDPITLYIEDFGEERGQITIKCYTDVWSYYWGSMGEGHTIKSFFCKADKYYLVDKLMPHDKLMEADIKATIKEIKKHILKFRTEEGVSKEDMRDYWDQRIKDPGELNDMESLHDIEQWACNLDHKIGAINNYTLVFEYAAWYELIINGPTPDTIRLRDYIIPAIKEAFKELEE